MKKLISKVNAYFYGESNVDLEDMFYFYGSGLIAILTTILITAIIKL